MKEDRRLFSKIRALNPELRCVLFSELISNLNKKMKVNTIDIKARISYKKANILLEKERIRLEHQNKQYYGNPIINIRKQ